LTTGGYQKKRRSVASSFEEKRTAFELPAFGGRSEAKSKGEKNVKAEARRKKEEA